MTIAEAQAESRFAHEALIYDTDDEYVAALAPFLREGLATGGVAMAVVPERNAQLLRAALGDDADGVEFVDADTWYERPSSTIAKYDAVLRGLAAGTRAWVVGEVRFGDSDREHAEWTRYEAALNRALEHHDAHVICPYDARLLPQQVVEDARCTHHLVLDANSETGDVTYVEPESFIPQLRLAPSLPTGTPDVEVSLGSSASPRSGRVACAEALQAGGIPIERAAELTFAVNEILTNALVHGDGDVQLQIWTSPDEVTCAIHDNGPGLDDPLAGLCPPRSDARASGMWLVRQLFEHVELVQRPGGLSVILTATR